MDVSGLKNEIVGSQSCSTSDREIDSSEHCLPTDNPGCLGSIMPCLILRPKARAFVTKSVDYSQLPDPGVGLLDLILVELRLVPLAALERA